MSDRLAVEEVRKRGYKYEDAPQPGTCNGCTFDQEQHIGVRCSQVPCSEAVFGRDVIWLKDKR